MNLPADIFSSFWVIASFLLLLPLLLWAGWRADWARMQLQGMTHVWLAISVALMVLWYLRAGIHDGLDLHLLGLTFMTLLFGWRFALLGGFFALAGVTYAGAGSWETLALNAWGQVVMPVLVSYWTYYLVDRHLPRHFFVYVFLNGFVGGMLAITTAGLVAFGLASTTDAFSALQLENDFLLFLPMLIFPEGLMNGMAIAIAVIYRPQWVWSFDDSLYLQGK
ncbi:MAG: energy-coupling factor ABC transporter permease [Gammaproteobacteria bacterium]